MSKLTRRKPLEQIVAKGGGNVAKTLTTLDLTLLGIGATIGTGVLVLTGLVAATEAGPGVMLSFTIASLVCALAALCYAEIASAIPVYGSVYIYSYTTIGEFIAHLMGWTLLSVYLLTTSAVASGWTGYFSAFVKEFGVHIPEVLLKNPAAGGFVNLPAVIITLLITALLSRGTRESKKFNNAMVFVKLFVILLFVVVGIFYVNPANFTPFLPFGVQGVITGAASVFFAYLGFDALSSSAEEVREPQRSLPIGILASLGICTLIYVLVCFVMTGVVSYQELNVPEAMSYVLLKIGQNLVAGFVSIGAVIGIMAVIFAYIYASTRVSLAMSRDGLLPSFFAKMNSRSQAPVQNTWAMGILAALIAGFIDLKELSNLANIGALLTFAMVSLNVLILRKTHPDLSRGFRVPFVPVIPILSIVLCLFLMINLPLTTWMYFSVWILLGIVLYFLYSMNNSKAQ